MVGWVGGWFSFRKYFHFVAPSCKLGLARFSDYLRIQDGAECGKNQYVLLVSHCTIVIVISCVQLSEYTYLLKQITHTGLTSMRSTHNYFEPVVFVFVLCYCCFKLCPTGCPKKHMTLFVKAVIFRPRIARGWYYTNFEADHLRLETSTHILHRCFQNLIYSQISLEISKQKCTKF